MTSRRCTGCGAPLPADAPAGQPIECRFCGLTFEPESIPEAVTIVRTQHVKISTSFSGSVSLPHATPATGGPIPTAASR